MSCRGITHIIREARTAGILIELDESGNLRLRAPNEPPQAMIQHLRAHKRELVTFLKAKAAAEEAEGRLVANHQQLVSAHRAVPKRQVGKTAPEQAVPMLVPLTGSRDSG
jgi:hypothetical protein